jgi:hypothetical protein
MPITNQIKIEFVTDPSKLNPNGLLETAKDKREHYSAIAQLTVLREKCDSPVCETSGD